MHESICPRNLQVPAAFHSARRERWEQISIILKQKFFQKQFQMAKVYHRSFLRKIKQSQKKTGMLSHVNSLFLWGKKNMSCTFWRDPRSNRVAQCGICPEFNVITHLLNYGISHNLKPQYILSADEYHEKLDQPLIPIHQTYILV